MEWKVDAIFDHGVLRPVDPLPLKEAERVHITVESNGVASGVKPSDGEHASDRSTAHRRLIEHLRAAPGYSLGGVYPTREELHER